MELKKTCKKHGELTLKDIKPMYKKNGYFSTCCRICVRNRQKIYSLKNKSKINRARLVSDKKYIENNRDQIRKRAKIFYWKNRLKIIEKNRENIKNLSDSYVKRTLVRYLNIPSKEVSTELIDFKRELKKLKRILYEIKKNTLCQTS